MTLLKLTLHHAGKNQENDFEAFIFVLGLALVTNIDPHNNSENFQ